MTTPKTGCGLKRRKIFSGESTVYTNETNNADSKPICMPNVELMSPTPTKRKIEMKVISPSSDKTGSDVTAESTSEQTLKVITPQNIQNNKSSLNNGLTKKSLSDLPGLDHETFHLQATDTDSQSVRMKLTNTNAQISAKIAEREEKLRKLKMAKIYRSKNDLTDLQQLIDKWRDVSQQALQDLVSQRSDTNTSLSQLIDFFNLDHKLLDYNPEDECFN